MSDPTSSDAKPRFSLVAAPPTPSSTANAPNPPSSQHPTEQPVTAPRNDVQQDAKEVEKAVGLSSRPVAVGSPLANLVLQIPQHARGQTPTEKTKSTVHHQPIDPTNRCATNSSLRHAAGQFVRAPIRQPTIDLNQPPPGPRVGRRTPSLNDPERDDVPQSPIETSEELHSSWILRIVDVPFDRSDPCRILLVHDPAQDIGASLKRVTQHSGGRARIIEYTFDREFIPLKYELPIQQNLVQHFANAYGLESPTLDYMIHGEGLKRHRGTPATDIEAICSQFLQTSESFPLKKIWTRSMLRPGMLDGPLAMSKSYYCCAEVGENRLVDRILAGRTQWISIASGALKQCAQFLVMDFLLTCVYLQEASYFEDFLLLDQEKFEDDPLFHMIFSLPHRFNQVPSGSDSDIIGQLQECEQILQTVQDVTGAILFLLKVMDLQPPSTSPTGGELSFECQHRAKYLRLRETCSQRVLNCERRIERINRTIETQNKLLNIRESTSVKRLTILAALFLPASLASSFLSMSTRFKNLGPLLYDWLGVLVIISSATIVLNFGVRAILYAKAKISRAIWSPWAGWTVGRKFERPVSKLASRIFVVMQLLVYLAVWGIILACFALGMFRDFKLGGRVLGYGIAGIAAFILFFPLIVVCLVLTTPRPERSSRTTLTRSSDRP